VLYVRLTCTECFRCVRAAYNWCFDQTVAMNDVGLYFDTPCFYAIHRTYAIADCLTIYSCALAIVLSIDRQLQCTLNSPVMRPDGSGNDTTMAVTLFFQFVLISTSPSASLAVHVSEINKFAPFFFRAVTRNNIPGI